MKMIRRQDSGSDPEIRDRGSPEKWGRRHRDDGKIGDPVRR